MENVFENCSKLDYFYRPELVKNDIILQIDFVDVSVSPKGANFTSGGFDFSMQQY